MSIIMYIIIGVFGISIIVLVHEIGHLLVAKLFKLDVLIFSVGFGPKLYSFTHKDTIYQICAIPLGGFCHIDDGDYFTQLKAGNDISQIKDNTFWKISFYKRILIAVAGPLFNVIFTFLVFIFLVMIGYLEFKNNSQVVLRSDVDNKVYVADRVGLKTGDYIVKINNDSISHFEDIRQILNLTNLQENIDLVIIRDQEKINLSISAIEFKKEKLLGLMPWIDPILSNIDEKTRLLGFQDNDKIISINGNKVAHSLDVQRLINQYAQENMQIQVERDLDKQSIQRVIMVENARDLMFSFYIHQDKIQSYQIPTIFSIASQRLNVATQSMVRNLWLLFTFKKNFKESVVSPIGIIYLLGRSTVDKFQYDWIAGLVVFLRFSAYISLALAIMNLLPIVPLDGGIIVLSLVEGIIRRKISYRIFSLFYFLGISFLLFLFILAIGLDIFDFGRLSRL